MAHIAGRAFPVSLKLLEDLDRYDQLDRPIRQPPVIKDKCPIL